MTAFFQLYCPKDLSPDETTRLQDIKLVLNAGREQFKFSINPAGNDILRKVIRFMYSGQTDRKTSLNATMPNTVLDVLSKRQSVILTLRDDIPSFRLDVENPLRDNETLFDRSEIIQSQLAANLYRDDELTDDDVHLILLAKELGQRVTLSKGNAAANHLVMRATVQQHFNDAGQCINKPFARTVYLTCFPKLNATSTYVMPTIRQRHELELDPNKELELKTEYKKIMRLNLQVAASNHEAFALLTPSAFLSDLKLQHQKKARELFYDALFEVGQEGTILGLTFVTLHFNPADSDYIQTKLASTETNPLHFPLFLSCEANTNAMAQVLGSKGTIGEAIMGEPFAQIGNGAAGDRANSAAEERCMRLTGVLGLILSSAFNQELHSRKIVLLNSNPPLVTQSRFSPLMEELNQSFADIKIAQDKNKVELAHLENEIEGLVKHNNSVKNRIEIGMFILEGFFAVAGATLTFLALSAATFGLAELAMAAVGVTSLLVGVGLFSLNKGVNEDSKKSESVDHRVIDKMAVP